jgi:hypothetical protein
MSANVYISKDVADSVRFSNDSGADMSQYDFDVVGPWAAIADEDVSSAATGGFTVREGIQFQTTTLKTAENTFGTAGQAVYWDATNKQFSDTSNAGYYLVGYLVKTKDSNGMIVVEKLRYAELVTS